MNLNLDLSGILNEARRQALLSGKPFTDQDTLGVTNAWKNSAMNLANGERQQQLGQDQLAQQRWATQAQMDAAHKAQNNQLFGNLINTGGSMLGMDWLRNKQAGTPGDSLVSKGWSGAKDLFNNGMDKMGNLFGLGTPAPPPDYTGMGSLNMAPSGAGPGTLAAPAVGGLPGAVPMAAPVTAPAGAPSLAPDITTSLSDPASLGVDMGASAPSAAAVPMAADAGANVASDAGIGLTGYGAIAGLSDMADRMLVRPNIKGLGDWGKGVEDVLNPLGAVHDLVGTWICTATEKNAHLTKKEEYVMSKLRSYAQENHPGWWDSYFKNGTYLVKKIAEKEENLSPFYENIRRILVEPVVKIFYEEPEAAFQIYLFVTQTLFKAYMPDFEFKEIE